MHSWWTTYAMWTEKDFRGQSSEQRTLIAPTSPSVPCSITDSLQKPEKAEDVALCDSIYSCTWEHKPLLPASLQKTRRVSSSLVPSVLCPKIQSHPSATLSHLPSHVPLLENLEGTLSFSVCLPFLPHCSRSCPCAQGLPPWLPPHTHTQQGCCLLFHLSGRSERKELQIPFHVSLHYQQLSALVLFCRVGDGTSSGRWEGLAHPPDRKILPRKQ